MASSLLPFLTDPPLIYPEATNLFGRVCVSDGVAGLAPAYVPILRNGVLWAVVNDENFNSDANQATNIYQSLDKGQTWSGVDLGNGPVCNLQNPFTGAVYDGDHRFLIAYLPDGGGIFNPGPGSIALQYFDLDSATWGAPFAPGSPQVWLSRQCFIRPDGSIIVFACPINTGSFIEGLSAYVWDGSSWSSFACDTNVPAGYIANSNLNAIMDSDGNIHAILVTPDHATGDYLYFYQLVLADNTLGPSTTIQHVAFNSGHPDPSYNFGDSLQLAISDGNLIVGLPDLSGQFATIYVGTPLTNPTFTNLSSPGIDPVLPTDFFRFFPPVVSVDSTGIYAAYLIQRNDGGTNIRLCYNPNPSTPLVGWDTAITAFNSDNIPPTGSLNPSDMSELGISRQGGNTLAVLNGLIGNNFPNVNSSFWLGVFPVTIPTIIPGVGAGGFEPGAPGVPYIIHKYLRECRPANCFDESLWAKEYLYRHITFPPLCSIPPELCNVLPWDDFRAVPHEAVPFNHTAGILTPSPSAGDQVVVTLSIPLGYDGLLAGIWWLYSGLNFVQGSGDIIWRIRLNQRYAKDLSNVPFQLGSPITPMPMTEGMILFSGQSLQVITNVPNLSGQIQVGASTISAGLIGFFWPR